MGRYILTSGIPPGVPYYIIMGIGEPASLYEKIQSNIYHADKIVVNPFKIFDIFGNSTVALHRYDDAT